MKREAVLNLRLPKDVKAAIQDAAEADHGRSMSSMAVRIFREWLSENGYLALESEPSKATRKAKRP